MPQDVRMLEQSIPKVIHYCWFGRGPKSELIQKCIASWEQHCPDWNIIEWNEDNFDVSFCPFSQKAYKEKRYAFLSDAARLKIIFDNGGVYLDTDAELRRSLDALCDNDAWFGYATSNEIGTGVGFGATKNHPFINRLLNSYYSYDLSKKYALCTETDTKVFSNCFPSFAANHKVEQCFCFEGRNVRIINNIYHYATHHYTNSWMTPAQKVYTVINSTIKRVVGNIQKIGK